MRRPIRDFDDQPRQVRGNEPPASFETSQDQDRQQDDCDANPLVSCLSELTTDQPHDKEGDEPSTDRQPQGEPAAD